MQEALWLVFNGVPFDLAFQLDEATRAAYCIVFQEFNGRRFNWRTLAFEDPQ